MRVIAALLAASLAAPAALAQPGPAGAPDTRRQGENWNMRQDLTSNENTARPASAPPSEEARRAQRQAQQQQRITGTGRAVAQMPESTPNGRPAPATPPRPAGAGAPR